MQKKMDCPNLLLISGTGKNVSKTLFACDVIRHLSAMTTVFAIKISPHFHELEQEQKIIVQNNRFLIIEEMLQSNKDSSRMKNAGAAKSYYIQVKEEYTLEAFKLLYHEIGNHAIVCESGGLHNFVKPGLFFLVKGDDIPENKMPLLKLNPIIVNYNSDSGMSVDLIDIQFHMPEGYISIIKS